MTESEVNPSMKVGRRSSLNCRSTARLTERNLPKRRSIGFQNENKKLLKSENIQKNRIEQNSANDKKKMELKRKTFLSLPQEQACSSNSEFTTKENEIIDRLQLDFPNAKNNSGLKKSKLHDLSPSKPRLPPRRRSYDCTYLTHNSEANKDLKSTATPCRLRHRLSYGNRPDGSEACQLGPRGVPDGAESSIRDSFSKKKSTMEDDAVELEQHYLEVKSAVLKLEKEEDMDNLEHLRGDFSENSSTFENNMTYSEMIQSAYEKIKYNSRDLSSTSPSESMSRRLGHELKIKKRRSGENRVMRSPSERRIGVLRRRSKEMLQNAAKLSSEDGAATNTPKLKSALLQTPLNASLKRGKPNSLRSGLPVVVKPEFDQSTSCEDVEESTIDNLTSRTVFINRRSVDDSLHPLKSTFSTVHNDESNENVSISYSGEKKSSGKRKSRSLSPFRVKQGRHSLSFNSSSQSLDGSFIETLPENSRKITARRRSNLNSGEIKFLSSLNMEEEDMNDNQVKINLSRNFSNLPSTSSIEDNSEEWHRPSDILNDDKTDGHSSALRYDDDCGGSRPSIAALIRQRKVTENVQLFNNLTTNSPVDGQQSRLLHTPFNRQATPSLNSKPRITPRTKISFSQMTPHERLKAKQRSLNLLNQNESTKIAIVTPLRENNFTESSLTTRNTNDEIFKAPKPSFATPTSAKPPRTPILDGTARTRPTKAFSPAVKLSLDVPPKLPPRTFRVSTPSHSKFR